MLTSIKLKIIAVAKAASAFMACAVMAVSLPVAAQSWPNKPIRMLVTFPPGNTSDSVARAFGARLSQKLGQPIVVDNRAGAGGMIGVSAIVAAEADGYTLGISSLSPITILPAIRKNMPYNPVVQLDAVSLLALGANVVVVRKDLPVNSIAQLVEYSKTHPGKLTYGSLGPGTISQLIVEIFKRDTGANIVEVSYKGSAMAQTDLLGGRIDLTFDNLGSALPQIKAGRLKPLAVTTRKRSAFLPDVPTLQESGIAGLKGFDFFGWVGAFVPAQTPSAIVERLRREFAEISQESNIQQSLATAGLEVAPPMSQSEFREFIQRDGDRWAQIVRDLKLEPVE